MFSLAETLPLRSTAGLVTRRAGLARPGPRPLYPPLCRALHKQPPLRLADQPVSRTGLFTLSETPAAQDWPVFHASPARSASWDGPRGQPTESEEDVVADRSDVDPLPLGKHHAIQMPAGGAASAPTESEQDVVADRSGEDPLVKGPMGKKA